MSKSQTTIDVSPERLRENADNLSPSGSYWVCNVLKAAADEIERLREDRRTLAHFVLGITPDRNTQTDEQVAATATMVEDIAREALNV